MYLRIPETHVKDRNLRGRFLRIDHVKCVMIRGAMRAFHELGTLTSTYWDKLGRNLDSFPEAAVAALSESNLLNTCSFGQIIEWLVRSADIPEQYGKDFAQPPINVFVGNGFYIEVLFWIDGTTSIHEHRFVGAFGVLAGSSVHSKYGFDLLNPLSNELRLGNVKFLSSELLQRGDIRAISSGNGFIHSLFHLQRPSISVVIRSNVIKDVVQYSYLKPYVAIDPFYPDEALKVKLRLLDSLSTCESQTFWTYVNLIVEDATPWLVFNILTRAYHKSKTDGPDWQRLVSGLVQQHGADVIARFGASILEQERTKMLQSLRTTAHDPAHRFLLALLLNVPERDLLLTMVSKEYGTQQPQSLVLQWIKEMFAAGLFRTSVRAELFNTLELAVQHGSYDKARKAIGNGEPSGNSMSLDEQEMRKRWDEASSITAFRPLFCAKA